MSRSLFFILALLWTSVLGAHPMGNFSINHYARLEVASRNSTLTYVLDFAEIPTFELLQQWNIDGQNASALQRRAAVEAKNWLGDVLVKADHRKITPLLKSVGAAIQSGAGRDANSASRYDRDVSPAAGHH